MGGSLHGANPEFTAKDVSAGGTDQVLAALGLPPLARRAILAIPLFAGAGYEERISQLGGRIVFLAPVGTWSFVPDSFWKEGLVGKHVGYIQHPVVVVFDHSEGADWGWDGCPFVDTVESWWAARAPGGRPPRPEEHDACKRGSTRLASMDAVVGHGRSGKQDGDGNETPEEGTGRGEGAGSGTRK